MRFFYVFFLFGFLQSCLPTNKQIISDLSKNNQIDYSYFQLDLPLYTRNTSLDFEMLALDTLGYIRLINVDAWNRPIYEVTNKGYEYFICDYTHDQCFDSHVLKDHMAIFKYYRLKKISLTDIKSVNGSRDTLEVLIKTQYETNPMFNFPQQIDPISAKLVKTKTGWVFTDLLRLIPKLYNFKESEKWFFNHAFKEPYQLNKFRDSLRTMLRKKN